MGKQKYTRDDIIRALKHADSTSDKPVGTSALKEMGISPHWVRKLFPGESLTEVKREHGIRLSPQEIHRSDDELLEMLDEVISQEKSIPCWTVLGHQTGIAEGTWKNRLGKTRNCSKEDVYRRYEQWLRVSKPLSPNLKIVRGFLDPPEMSETSRAIRDPARSPKRQARTYQKGDGRVYTVTIVAMDERGIPA